jgi:Transposase domain (DUF772)
VIPWRGKPQCEFGMRGRDGRSDGLFTYVPADHLLRAIRSLVDEALGSLHKRFGALYSRMGRPSIPPEMLLRATLLQAFFSVRSGRMLMEQINHNLLFRWFVGLPMDADVWHPTAFTHNRDRLMERMSRMSFWQRFWRCHRSRSFCRASTFRSTAR